MIKKLNNKGFTIAELLITMVVGFILLYAVLYIPHTVYNYYKIITVESTHNDTIAIMQLSILKDISSSNGAIVETSNGFKLNNNEYIFNNGVSFKNEKETTKLTNLNLNYLIEGDFLIINSLIKDKNSNQIYMKFFLKHNKGADYYE